ncbi:MAG TPA: rhodanese-like domain-containing protein [Nocardioidaceae bacterium]|nr:rhodanese-like domain-containing protein [Nocardioidaceae bacterium]
MTSISVALRVALAGPLLVMALVMTSCGSSEADGEVDVVPPREAVELMASGDYTVLDVRSREAFEAGHVRGAVSLPVEGPGFRARLHQLDRDERYLVYSRSGESAEQVAERMVAEGFEDVVDAGAFGLLAIAGAPLT